MPDCQLAGAQVAASGDAAQQNSASAGQATDTGSAKTQSTSKTSDAAKPSVESTQTLMPDDTAVAAPASVIIKTKTGTVVLKGLAILPPPRLDAKVTETRNFPPLPKNMRPGSIFSKAEAEKMLDLDDSRWYEVPAWMAGELDYGSGAGYYEKNFETNQVNTNMVRLPATDGGRYRGLLVDKVGKIWMRSHCGNINMVSFSAQTGAKEDPNASQRYENANVGFEISPTQYVEFGDGVEFELDKSGRIEVVTRYERTKDFSLQGGRVNYDVKEVTYDMDGKPICECKSRGVMTKAMEFEALRPGMRVRGGPTYEQAVASLRSFMEKVGKLADAPEEQ